MTNDLNDMMVFLAVVETGSFTLAADRLNIPKANVSRKVSRLEKQLQVTLLERSTRSQHLTEAGKNYLNHCKRIHEEIDLANASVNNILTSHSGNLKVGASVATGHHILKPALASFLNKYPELNLHLSLLNRRVDFIEEGFDVVIRIGQLNDSSLIAKKLGTLTRSLYASPGYLTSQGTPKKVEHLNEHNVLIMNPINNDYQLKLISNQGIEFTQHCKPRLLVDDFAMLKQSLIDGLGISVMPNYMCTKEVSAGKLVKILPDWRMESVDVYALYPKNRAKIPKVKSFIEFIQSLYQKTLI